MKRSYDQTFKCDQVDTFHGIEIPNPYAWLEDPNSEQTKEWVSKQAALTTDYLSTIDIKDKVLNKMKQLYNFPKYGCPSKHGDKYFFSKNNGLQNQFVTYMQDTLQSDPTVFFDPNLLSEDGTITKTDSCFSESGEFYAYMLSANGSDWNTLHIKTVDSNHSMADKLNEKLEWIKFSSISFTHDNKGFFYSRYPATKNNEKGTENETLQNHSLYYHYLGTDQSEDVLIYNCPDNPNWTISGDVTDDGKYLIVTISKSCDNENLFYYYELTNFSPKKEDDIVNVVKLVDTFEAEYNYVTNEGPIFYLKTNLNAPLYKLITIDITNLTTYDVIPQHNKDVLEQVYCVHHNKLMVIWIKDVVHVLSMYDLTGELLSEFKLDLGTISSFSGDKKLNEVFFCHVSFLSPSVIYTFNFDSDEDMKGSELSIFNQTKLDGFDMNLFCSKQVFYPSKDGTMIPMFIIHKKGLNMNGQNPTVLYGYGGFNVSIQPSFSTTILTWINNFNGVFAVANIRGGGEYGEQWHEAGKQGNKQNVFDDFQCAGEYLIEQSYTCSKKLAINGGSNGGLLVAACLNQRPELYGCAICEVGVLDMLKFHKFTIGHFWTSDYGCADNKADFEYLIKYSPIHNVNKNKVYPSTMLTTGNHDDRVSPFHSYKYISTLQNELNDNPNPLLIRIAMKAGHGSGKPTSKILEEKSDIYSFIANELGAVWID
jgi:prolyl oligopeptidase